MLDSIAENVRAMNEIAKGVINDLTITREKEEKGQLASRMEYININININLYIHIFID